MLPAVVVSESADAGAPDFAQTVATIAGFTTGPVFAAGRSPDERWASELLAAILA
jgi:hypothetical protein